MHNTSNNKHREAELAHIIAEAIDTSGFNYHLFNQAMAKEHRTVQQLWMKAILNYIRFAASNEYRTDSRNKRSHEIAKYIDFCLDGVNTYLPLI